MDTSHLDEARYAKTEESLENFKQIKKIAKAKHFLNEDHSARILENKLATKMMHRI
jgi:hypothetical protein